MLQPNRDTRLWSTNEGTTTGQDLPTRDAVAPEHRWRLEDIYATLADWEADAKWVSAQTQKLTGLAGKLGESAGTLLEALRLQDDIGQTIAKLFVYARMRRDEDNTNATYQALADKAMTLMVSVESARSFFVPEVLDIPEEKLMGFLEENTELQLYRFLLQEILREKPHILSAKEEQLLAAAGDVMDAPSQIFTMFNDADMRFPKIRDEDGREVEITHGRYIQFLESTNRDVRRNAFEAVYATYDRHRNTLASLAAANVKKDVYYAQARNYSSAREMALDSDNVPVAVYDNLIESVHEALPALHKYMNLRKQALGLDDLHLYDMYTPIVPESNAKVSYDEAVKTVEAAVAVLGDDYQRIASDGMRKQGWVDVFETRGKTSGAYSWGTYGTHPYILLNYQETLDNMFTLAHELGHAMHRYYSDAAQPYVYSSYTIFVAEVASTCNEALLLHHLLETTEDKKKRAYLINHQLESIRGTLYRQTMFAEFEKLTHAHVESGEALTPEWLCQTYYALNERFFGEVAVVDQQIEMEWSRIPHFYNAFYVYKYATGISAATALSEKILNEGQPAVERYLTFLKSGGSDYPIHLLRSAGVDMESPEPVRATLDLFSRRVDELASLL
jgi:oligoendopeptidase F